MNEHTPPSERRRTDAMGTPHGVFAALWWLGGAVLAGCASTPVHPSRAEDVVKTIAMIEIPGGAFDMGVQADDPDAFQSSYPVRRVSIRPFRLSQHTVTFDQYDAFARQTGRPLPDDAGWGRGSRPVINVDWQDVQAFIGWLNTTGRHFRLPSESEYEYAARAGTRTRYWWGDKPDPTKANTAVNQPPDIWPHTSPTGSFPPNPYGLYDIVGNVWEWVADCRRANLANAPTDGTAWLTDPCEDRVIRGGGWESVSRGIRTTARAAAHETTRSSALGFRIAENITARANAADCSRERPLTVGKSSEHSC